MVSGHKQVLIQPMEEEQLQAESHRGPIGRHDQPPDGHGAKGQAQAVLLPGLETTGNQGVENHRNRQSGVETQQEGAGKFQPNRGDRRQGQKEGAGQSPSQKERRPFSGPAFRAGDARARRPGLR